MKKILYMAVAAIAVLSSCSSEDIADNNNSSNGAAKVFTGTIENDNPVSRSTYDSSNKKANWESTDQISINGAVYSVAPHADNASKADFYHQSGTAPTAPYYAFYADGANTGTGSYDATKHTFTLPASYNYAAGKFNMPMYAYSASSTELKFKNLCGVLAITVPSEQMSSVSKIIVTSDQQLNGEFTATEEGVPTFSSTATDDNKKITLNVVAGGTGNVYYIPVPANSHKLQVAVSDGTTTKVSYTTSAATIERNKIYKITFAGNAITGEATVLGTAGISGNKAAWVQLWAGGPKFATINVGQTVTDYSTITTATYSLANVGGLYTWGGTNNFNVSSPFPSDDHNTNYTSGTTALSDADDTATKLWGSAWCMPTKAQLNKLRNYDEDGSAALSSPVTTWTWCTGEEGSQYVSGCTLAGYKVSGVGAYSSNSVFFPAAGNYSASYGMVYSQGSDDIYCWSSSSPSGSVFAYSLNFFSNKQSVGEFGRSNGYSVRAVLK